ncbi:GNAT family N-acetyltransferase [Fusibacter bizertensis]
MSDFINLSKENLETEHVCCAISDKKHQIGVNLKKEWLTARIEEGHTFRKLDAKGKVFIEYAPLEKAWVPVIGENYYYIYCLWVSGSYKGKGYAKSLLESCIAKAKEEGKSGICVLSSKKKTPFLSDKAFLIKHGFKVVSTYNETYELLALSFDGTLPKFSPSVGEVLPYSEDLVIYYTHQCPYSHDCITQVTSYTEENGIDLKLIHVDSLEKAKNLPSIFNNWAVFYKGQFETIHLLNKGFLEKLIEKKQ